MNTNVAASFSTETLEFLEKYYDLVHEASWLIIIHQVHDASFVASCLYAYTLC